MWSATYNPILEKGKGEGEREGERGGKDWIICTCLPSFLPASETAIRASHQSSSTSRKRDGQTARPY